MQVQGQWFSAETVEWIGSMVAQEPGISRGALSRAVCEHLDWRSPSGRLKEMSCRKGLLELERGGVLRLPACDKEYAFQKRGERPVQAAVDLPEVECELGALGAVELLVVPGRSSRLSAIWNELMDRCHPLGRGHLRGAQIRYLVHSERYGWVGALSFSGATWRLRARDEWIGWSAAAHGAHLQEVVCNSRFLIVPTVRVPNLASHVLSRATGGLADDWVKRYGYAPVLLETFVDGSRHSGASYQAANWERLGQTAARPTAHANGKVSQGAKDVYVYPLRSDWRAVLCAAPQRELARRPGQIGAADWAEEEFGRVRLSDTRLRTRLCTVARDMCDHMGAPIPAACGGDAVKTQGAYRFMANEQVDMGTIVQPHTEATLERLQGHKVVLAVDDTTTVNYTGHAPDEGMGPIGTKRDRALGLILHSTMAFTPEGTPLGLLDVQCWARDPATAGKRHRRKELPTGEKESAKWIRSYVAVAAVQALCPETTLVCMGDRESDLWDLFAEAATRQGGPELLIRAEKSRGRQVERDAELEREVEAEYQAELALEAGSEAKHEAETEPESESQQDAEPPEKPDHLYLWEHMAEVQVAGEIEVLVPTRHKQPGRTARVQVRFARVTLKAPKDKQPLGHSVWAVFAQEADAPRNVKEPLEWMLLTTVPTDDFEAAVERLHWYVRRWGIEVFHRTIKSGCRIEDRRLNTVDRIKNCLAIDLVIAWRVFTLAMQARETPDAPCDTLLTPTEWRVLNALHAREATPGVPPTLRQAVRWIAALGGFLGRKCDNEPGTTTLWRGLIILAAMAAGYMLRCTETQDTPRPSSGSP
jgi:hypothetical protein